MLTPEAIVEQLIRISETPFSGKIRGRFKIQRHILREISQNPHMEEILPKIVRCAFERGYLMFDLGDDFGFLEAKIPKSWRAVPKKVVFGIEDSDDFSDEIIDDELD